MDGQTAPARCEAYRPQLDAARTLTGVELVWNDRAQKKKRQKKRWVMWCHL
jgi:hypothetical protein